jgi:hypothetical protein
MKRGIFLLNLSKGVIILNSQGNENVRNHYSYEAIVITISCPFSFIEKKRNKKHTLDSLLIY